MNKRTPPFFCLLSKAPDKSPHHTSSQNSRNVAIPIIKILQA
jgi:hypothetical protein